MQALTANARYWRWYSTPIGAIPLPSLQNCTSLFQRSASGYPLAHIFRAAGTSAGSDVPAQIDLMNWKEDCGKQSTSNASARTRFTRSKRTTRWQLKAPTTIGREERHSTTAALVAKAVREGWSYRVRPAPVCDPRLRAGTRNGTQRLGSG